MEYLLELLGGVIQNEEQRRIVFLVLVAGAIFLLFAGISFLISGLTDPVKRRLSTMRVAGTAAPTIDSAKTQGFQHTLVSLVEPAAKYVLPQKEWERAAAEARLVHAGYRSPSAITIYYGIKTLLCIVFPLVVLGATLFYPDLTNGEVIFLLILAACVGLMLPNFIVERQMLSRKRRLRNAFPDALDLLVVCVESGLGLIAAIQRVAGEMDISHPELADELALVNTEIRLGITRSEALKNMAHRTGLEEIQSMVVVLDQSIRFGTSIAESLRVYAEEFRDKRMQMAEEIAAKVGTKLIFPLVVCIWPSFFVVAVGPSVMRVIKAFENL
ncbi:MAG: type II secretion system F family protein [Pseudomonadales bacterium]